jgi:hypothetical protein
MCILICSFLYIDLCSHSCMKMNEDKSKFVIDNKLENEYRETTALFLLPATPNRQSFEYTLNPFRTFNR